LCNQRSALSGSLQHTTRRSRTKILVDQNQNADVYPTAAVFTIKIISIMFEIFDAETRMPSDNDGRFDHEHYVPVLKWRQGEYQALWRLSEPVKDWISPLLEIPTEPWDFETETPAKSLDEHLERFGSRLKAKWNNRQCFIDSCYIDGSAQMATGQHHLEFLFDLARKEGAAPVPVSGLGRNPDYDSAVRNIIAQDHRGACVRLSADDFGDSISNDLHDLFARLDAGPPNMHLVIDMAEEISGSPVAQGLAWKALLQQTPWLNDWMSVTVAATSFPGALPAALFRPHGLTPRSEWSAYRALLANIGGLRIPTFGDYSVSHPQTELLDPRVLDPNAKIKYTVDGEWLIHTGTQVKRHGRGQFQDLCQQLVANPSAAFPGPYYSWGDAYIHGCANGTESTGGTSTWPSVGNNRHITKVTRDVATLFGSSMIP
jgi:hypothetical protein